MREIELYLTSPLVDLEAGSRLSWTTVHGDGDVRAVAGCGHPIDRLGHPQHVQQDLEIAKAGKATHVVKNIQVHAIGKGHCITDEGVFSCCVPWEVKIF